MQTPLASYFDNDNTFKSLDPKFQQNFLIGIENIRNSSTTNNNSHINTDIYGTLIQKYSKNISIYIWKLSNLSEADLFNMMKKNSYDVVIHNYIISLSEFHATDTNNIDSTVQNILDNFMNQYNG
jgi:hypothetical protein